MAAQIKEDDDHVLINLENEATSTNLSYLDQIDQIINTVMEVEAHLFDEEEFQTIAMYKSLQCPSQELYFRLLMRDHKPLRVNSLSYQSIPEVDVAIQDLLETVPPLLNIVYPTTLKEWMGFLRREELKGLAKSRKISCASLTVSDLKKALLSNASSQQEISFGGPSQANGSERLIKEIKSILGPLIILTPEVRQTFVRLSVVYSRDHEFPAKPFLESILSNLSVNRRSYPPYKVQRMGLVWPERTEFLKYMLWLERVTLIYQHLDAKEWKSATLIASAALPVWKEHVQEGRAHVTGIPWLQAFTSGWILTRILHAGAKAYFRLKLYNEQAEILDLLLSQRLYCPDKRGKWYEELTKILDLYIDKSRAIDLCQMALCDPFCVSGRRKAVQKRLIKLFKGKSRPEGVDFGDESEPAPFPDTVLYAYKRHGGTTGSKAMWIDIADQETPLSVEDLALAHYVRQGWKGYHAENSIITTLFGLLFWDILFMDGIPGVFESPYQISPLDLGTVYFYESRKDAILERLKDLENGDFSILAKVDKEERPRETRCIGVNWRTFSSEDISQIVACLGGHRLAKICHLFAQTYWIHTGGVPDLCLWKYETREFKLVEVKGQGDVLSEKQKLWLECLRDFGVQAETLHVKIRKE